MRFRRLHPDFGVEVHDVELLNPTVDEIDELRAALDEHQLLLFRQGRIPPERHVEIVSRFGTPTDDSGDGKRWSVLHNQDRAGRIDRNPLVSAGNQDRRGKARVSRLKATCLRNRSTSLVV